MFYVYNSYIFAYTTTTSMTAGDPLKDDVIQEQIISAAERLFHAHGFNKVNMDDVARAIGKGRSSLYYYYKSKDEIFIAVMDIEIRKNIAEVSHAVDQAPTIDQKIHAFYLTKLKLAKKRKELYNAVDRGMDADEMSRYTKVKRIIHKRMFDLEGDLLGRILDNGIKKGELVSIQAKDRGMLIYVLLSSLHGLKREMAIDEDFSKIEPAVTALTKILFNGIKK